MSADAVYCSGLPASLSSPRGEHRGEGCTLPPGESTSCPRQPDATLLSPAPEQHPSDGDAEAALSIIREMSPVPAPRAGAPKLGLMTPTTRLPWLPQEDDEPLLLHERSKV